ncbi:MAG: VOC family protein [Chitinophagaceae bacterium]|jgi:catechol 2,3-dioxygenase-like lactoylglutathione lyase family enzyme|nr:VOC family protein [Chitinophagaceae bacterium]
MAISPQTSGLHHVALRCSDFSITKNFYQNILGLQLALETEELMAFVAGTVIIVFKKASPPHEEDKIFTPFNIGLDHIALACDNEGELNRVAQGLAEAGIENTGVKTDPTLQKLYVAFKDPDRIQWEFYMA